MSGRSDIEYRERVLLDSWYVRNWSVWIDIVMLFKTFCCCGDEKGCVLMKKEPIRVLQIMGIVESGGVEAVIMNYYKHIDKSRVQFDFVVHKGSNPNYIAIVKAMGAKVYEVTPYTKIFLSSLMKYIRYAKKVNITLFIQI